MSNHPHYPPSFTPDQTTTSDIATLGNARKRLHSSRMTYEMIWLPIFHHTGTHMKTTIELPDALLSQAQQHAKAHKMTMKALIEQGLRRVMAETREEKPFRLRDGSFTGGTGLAPDLTTWEHIRDVVYDPAEGRG